MNIAIISDVHNNTANLKKVLDYCGQHKIAQIICCGDLASMETLDYLNDNFSGEIFYCFGNMDEDQLKHHDFEEKYKNTWIMRDYGEMNFGSKISKDHHIAFTHTPEDAEKLRQMEKYTHIFYGHTHKPWVERINNCTMLNPGNVANEIYPPTFSVWETENDKFDLIRINEI